MNDVVLRHKASRRSKFAIFDFDWTIVKPKEGRKFPKDVADWQYIRESVPFVIRELAKNHQIVILTDQSKDWKIDQIRAVVTDLGVVNTTIIGVKTQKPDNSLFKNVYPNIKPEKAFYVGDAAGRQGDWSDKDLKFAQSLGFNFFSPEEIFPLEPVKMLPKTANPKTSKEVVIMVGYPASGKSTIAKELGYHIVDGDKLKSAAAMIKDAKKHIAISSVVFDSTAGTKEKRAAYVNFAKELGLPVRVFWVQTSIDVSMERNKQRALAGGPRVPDIAFYVYRKRFEEPSEDEGFELVKISN
jgi:bifunctional polynucleotide phosphatase/kinase